MKTIVTGTVGLDKQPYLKQVQQYAAAAGQRLEICHVGGRMYAEAPDVAAGRILDLPISRLNTLRRSVFKDILQMTEREEHVVVNTHATFRWKHGLFPAWDFDQLADLDADMYVCLLDNVDCLHARLMREHQIDHSLKDLLVWREEEMLATEMMMMGCQWRRRDPSGGEGGNGWLREPAKFYLQAMGSQCSTAEMLYRLMFRPEMAKAYLSFPMTHVNGLPEVQEEIGRFRRAMMDQFIVFDPGDLEEHRLYEQALAALEQGQKVMEMTVLGEVFRFDVSEVMQAAGDIHAQIYARDFKLIEQSDMIVSYIPELANGQPAVSSGVERELQHAHESAKEVYVIWRPGVKPSPFVTETATKVFGEIDEAMGFFCHRGH